jgi:hypothetical protein
MSHATGRAGLAAAILAALVLTGCGEPKSQSRASAAQQSACQQQADQTFQTRNRGAIYSADAYVAGTRDSPFSATGLTGDTTSGLGARYSRDTIYNDCINGIGPPLGASGTAQAQPHPRRRQGHRPPP